MEEVKTIARKWGNSVGVRLPKVIADRQNIKDGTEIKMFIETKNKTRAGDIFGLLKGKCKKSTEQIMKEVDKELWGIER